MKEPFTKQDPLADSISEILKQSALDETRELEEGVEEIKSLVSSLKVKDKTNFGVVTKINNDSIEFTAPNTGKTKIPFKARKLGSKEFVLDKLLKLTKEDVELQEAVESDLKKIDSMFTELENQFMPNGPFVRSLSKEYGVGYKKDAADILKDLKTAYNRFSKIVKELSV